MTTLHTVRPGMVSREIRGQALSFCLMKHLVVLGALTGCESWNTPAERIEHAAPPPAEREPYRPELTIRTGGEGYGCPDEMVGDLIDAAERWREYTDGDFDPVLTTSDDSGDIVCRDNEGRAGSTAVACPSGSEPISVYECETDDGDVVPTFLRVQFRLWAMSGPAARRVAVHEFGHVYDFLGRVDFPEANSHGHTPIGIMSPSASGWAMPEIEYDDE